MAKPIGITPTLEGEDACEFLKRMKAGPTKEDKKFKKELKEAATKRRVHFIF
ncbi:MAG: hypothetical protein FWE58_04730 [Methanobrevibacter sp.]|nr:hypothetical protein [Methanobrevibacter sp.]